MSVNTSLFRSGSTGGLNLLAHHAGHSTGVEIARMTRSGHGDKVPMSVERIYRSAHWPEAEIRSQADDADAAVVSFKALPAMQIVEAGRIIRLEAREAMHCTLVDMDQSRLWRETQDIENITFVFSRDGIAGWAEEHDFKKFDGLEYTSHRQIDDPVLVNFAKAIAPSLEACSSANQLFVDYILDATLAYVVRTYGRAQQASIKGGLAPWQARIAKDLVRSTIGESLPLKTIAEACHLSVSHFVKSFRSTVGTTPHQYLLRCRVEAAVELLGAQDSSLAEIAMKCGFADQSHFTRTFSRIVGVSPGAWRRAHGIQSGIAPDRIECLAQDLALPDFGEKEPSGLLQTLFD